MAADTKWDTKWFQGDEKANDPLSYDDYLEVIHNNPLRKKVLSNDHRFNQAEHFIRRTRWRAGYEVKVRDDGTLGPSQGIRAGWASGIGHIVDCDRNFITVQWTTYLHGDDGIKRFSRTDPRVIPRGVHIQNIIANGRESCLKYEYDEEKVDVNGNVICNVLFNGWK